jgi:DNA invertase Pin-like site-specific DNA recombinase
VWLNGGCWTLLSEFTEVESGKRSDRPQLAAALRQCKVTGATLVIAKLDRLSRNMAFLAALMDGSVEFVACDNPTASRFTLHILAAVAEHEAAMISQRTRAALQAARERGVKLGGYRGTVHCDPALGTAANARKAQERADLVAPALAEVKGLSLRAAAVQLNARGVMAPRGGAWTPEAVRRALARSIGRDCRLETVSE